MKTDRLFFEFMQEVYKEKHILRDYKLLHKDIKSFFRRKAEQSEQIAGWMDITIKKLIQVYKRILSESGFAKHDNKDIEILPQIMEEELINHIKNIGDTIYLEAMLGVV